MIMNLILAILIFVMGLIFGYVVRADNEINKQISKDTKKKFEIYYSKNGKLL